MRKFLVISTATLAILLAILFIAPQFIPAEQYKEQIEDKVEAMTGRELSIDGAVGLRLLPRVQMTMHDVQLDNPDDFDGVDDEPMMRLRELQISLQLLPLLRGEIVIDQFKLVEPAILLARNAKGEANWVFTPEDDTATAEAVDAAREGKPSGFATEVQLPHLEIIDGLVQYRATPEAKPVSLRDMDVILQAPSLRQKATLDMSMVWNDTVPIKVSASLDTPATWLAGEDTAYTATLDADNGNLIIKSKGTANAALIAKGEVEAQSPSLKTVGKRLGVTVLPDSMQGEGKLKLSANFAYAEPKLSLDGLALTLDTLAANGNATVDMGGKRPAVTAALSMPDVLDLNAFTAAKEPTIRPPKTQESATPQGWSNAPLLEDTTLFKAADVDIRLSLGGIRLDKLALGEMRVHTQLKNGTLDVDVPDFAFYDGTAAINATIKPLDARRLSLRNKASIHHANVGQFLREAYDFQRLEGNGNLSLHLSTNGSSLRDLMQSLNGDMAFDLKNGAIRGINIAETVREARTLVKSVKNRDFTTDMRSQPAATEVKTDFAELSGTVSIAQGVASNQDLKLLAPLLTLTGKGTVNLPAQTVDYRLRPTIVASLEGEGRTQAGQNELSIPLHVTGTFDTLRFRPDASGLVQDVVKDPKGTLKNLEDNVRGLRDEMKSLFKGK